jgi:hypothetical protein
VYPAGDPLTGQIRTASHARVSREQVHLLHYLLETGSVHEIREGLEECLFQTSANVRQMIQTGDPRWRSYVPQMVLEKGPWAAITG